MLEVETKTASRFLIKAKKCGIVRDKGKIRQKYVLPTEDNL